MHELDALNPESLRALVERERGMVQDLAGLVYCAQVYPQRRRHLLDMESRLAGLSPEVRRFVEGLTAATAMERNGTFDDNALIRELCTRSVHHWLYTAIEQLADSAQHIVLRELIQHVESTLAEEPANLPHETRMANALARLGTAENVARDLARVHLLKGEDRTPKPGMERMIRWTNLFLVPVALLGPWETDWIPLRIAGWVTLWPLALLLVLRACDTRPDRAWQDYILLNMCFFLHGTILFIEARWFQERGEVDTIYGGFFALIGGFGVVVALYLEAIRRRKLAYARSSSDKPSMLEGPTWRS